MLSHSRPEPVARPDAPSGIVSCWLAAALIIGILAAIVADRVHPGSFAKLFFDYGGVAVLLTLTGFCFGLAGVLQRRKRRELAILGLVLHGVLGLVGLVLLGVAD